MGEPKSQTCSDGGFKTVQQLIITSPQKRIYSNPKSFVKNQKVDKNSETLTPFAFLYKIWIISY